MFQHLQRVSRLLSSLSWFPSKPYFAEKMEKFSQLSHKKQPTAAHCGQSRALLRSPLPASLHYAATSGHHVSTPCPGGASCEDGSPRFSLAKPDLASHCIRRLETGSFERNCFGQENLPKSLFQKSNFSRLNAEGIPAF